LAIVRVQGNKKGTNSDSSIAVTLDSSPTEGNLLIACVGVIHSTSPAPTVTGITQSNVSWTKQKDSAYGTGDVWVDSEIWVGVAAASPSANLTIALTGIPSARAITEICEYSGLATSGFLDKTASAGGNNASPLTGTTVSTNAANELWVGCLAVTQWTSSLTSPLNGFTLLGGAVTSGFGSVGFLEKIVSAVGTANSGASSPDWTRWAACIVTLMEGEAPPSEDIIDSYVEANYDSYSQLEAVHPSAGAYAGLYYQAFTGQLGYNLSKAAFYLQRNASLDCVLQAQLFAISGTYGTDAVPTGSALAVSDNVDSSAVATSFGLVEFTFSTPYALTGGYYAICLVVVSATTINGTDDLWIGRDASSPSHDGNRGWYSNSTYTPNATADIIFYVYGLTGEPPPITSHCWGVHNLVMELNLLSTKKRFVISPPPPPPTGELLYSIIGDDYLARYNNGDPSQWTAAILAKLSQWRCNTARLAFYFSDSGTWALGHHSVYVESKMNTVLDLFDGINVKGILDLHNLADHFDYVGTAAMTNNWKALATKWKDDPRVEGFNIFNEPNPSSWGPSITTKELLIEYFADLIDEIRAIDPARKIFFPVCDGMSIGLDDPTTTYNLMNTYGIWAKGNIVMDITHPYFFENSWDMGLTPEQKATWYGTNRIQPWIDLIGAENCWIGETFAWVGKTYDLQVRWLGAIVDECLAKNVGLQVWSYVGKQSWCDAGLTLSSYLD